MKNLTIIFVSIVLNACASKFIGNIPSFSPKQFSIICNDRRYLLSLSDEPHFALFDATLAPVVSRKIVDGRFVNAKFLPPDSSFDGLFGEILRMIDEGKNTLESHHCKVKELK